MQKQKFEPGQLAATRSVMSLVDQGLDITPLFRRHMQGDWGEVHDEDKQSNDQALIDGNRVLSAYDTDFGRVWIITEADHSSTTILLPDDY